MAGIECERRSRLNNPAPVGKQNACDSEFSGAGTSAAALPRQRRGSANLMQRLLLQQELRAASACRHSILPSAVRRQKHVSQPSMNQERRLLAPGGTRDST
jgi:hypothetical protein